MNETAFAKRGSVLIDQKGSAFDEAGIDVDFVCKGEGVLEVECADGSRIVVNSKASLRRIWVAVRTGGLISRTRKAHGSVRVRVKL